MKLPPFWLDNIETWLIQSEHQFCFKGVTCSQTKFDYVVQAVSQSDAVKLLDLIRAPPADPYRHLKGRLLKIYALTDNARYEAISSLPLSGDMLPSALMSKMLALLSADHQPCFFLHGAFLKHLQPDVRAHLVHDRTSDSLSLALHTDKIYQSRVSSASALNYVSSNPDERPLLAVHTPPASRPRSQHSSTPGSCPCCFLTPSSASRQSNSPSFCWYYRNHADKAQKCCSPCSWWGN